MGEGRTKDPFFDVSLCSPSGPDPLVEVSGGKGEKKTGGVVDRPENLYVSSLSGTERVCQTLEGGSRGKEVVGSVPEGSWGAEND